MEKSSLLLKTMKAFCLSEDLTWIFNSDLENLGRKIPTQRKPLIR